MQGRCAGKKVMGLSYESNGAAPAKSRDDHDDKSTREKWERKSAINLGLALIGIPLISLALWWAFLSVVWPVLLVKCAKTYPDDRFRIVPRCGCRHELGSRHHQRGT